MIPSLFPNDLERLSPGALSLLFKTWILRSLSIYVRDCLDVVGYDAAGSLVRTNLRNTSPAEFDPVAVGSLLARAWALCEARERLRNLEDDLRDRYEGVWERELARRALNDSITDVGFLAAIAATPFGSSVELLEQARLVAWIGIEQTVIAGELISPGIVFFEKVTREREARTQVTLT